VEVDGAGARLDRKARQLLAVLGLEAPAAVDVDVLAELLWDDPPPAATKAIQAHVSRLRRALGDAADLERAGHGYALRASDEHLDVHAVASLRGRARALPPDDAAPLLADARALWRGAPELPDTVAAGGLVARWQEERRRLADEHLAAQVDGSDPAAALAELHRATADEPHDQRAWELLVVALHRSGDVAGALRAYQAARAALADVGLEPGPALRRAEAEALASEPEQPDRPPVRYARTSDGAVAYVVAGDGDDVLVVLHAGLLSIDGIASLPSLAEATARLAGARRLVCLDRRGIGLSDPAPGAVAPLDAWVEDVVAVLDAEGVAGAAILASSDTAMVALAAAATHPERVRRLVLVHGYPRYTRAADYPYGVDPDTAAAATDDVLALDERPARFDPVAHLAPSVARDPGFRRWWDAVGRRAASPATAAVLHRAVHETDVRPLLGDVVAPTLLLHRRSCASCDVGHARFLAAHLRQATLTMLDGADELWFTGDTGSVLAEVERWLGEP
jgi:pimeloyl-ACP methyl ester carboxylesterase